VVEGRIANEWVRLRDHYRDRLEQMTTNMVRAGIAERRLQIEEARATLVISAIQEAAMKIGLPGEQVRDLGAALRRRLAPQEQPLLLSVDADAEDVEATE